MTIRTYAKGEASIKDPHEVGKTDGMREKELLTQG